MLISEMKGKKLAIWGLGQEGNATLKCLRHYGIDVPITIINDKPIPLEEKEALALLNPLEFVSGDEVMPALNASDIIIKAPGVSLYRPEIVEAKKQGKKITSGTNIFFAEMRKNNPNMKIVGVTGTKGKSTTSSLVAHFLRVAGFNTAVGGNIGVPLVEFLTSGIKFDATVAEISSYQASDIDYSPDVSLLVNLYPEHIDWHGSHERYYLDKLNLFAKRGGKTAILNFEDKRTREMCEGWQNVVYFNDTAGLHVGDGFIMDGMKRLIPFSALKLKGRHNFCNVCAALTVIKVLGGNLSLCANSAGAFEGLLHRLQILGEKQGITFVNDSISTTPETAVAAIEAFAGQPIVLLAGGYDRKQDYQVLAEAIDKSSDVRAVVTLPMTGSRVAETVKAVINKSGKDIAIIETGGLDEAFNQAVKTAPEGSAILLSPAAPSYGTYKDFKERGHHFMRLFKDL